MASIALHHGVSAMPVVDDAGRLVGVVGSTALMDILRREHVEDLHRLAGITRESDQARHALEEPPLRRARHRLPWLLVGLVGSMVATFVVARFESALAAKPALAFFVPGLVYLADAIGTQSEAVAVRGLSLSHVGIGRLIGSELRTGLLIGVVLALLAFPMVWLAFGEPAAGRRGRAGAGRREHRGLGARPGAALAAGPLRVGSGLRQRAAGDDRAGCAELADLLRLRLGHRAVRRAFTLTTAPKALQSRRRSISSTGWLPDAKANREALLSHPCSTHCSP